MGIKGLLPIIKPILLRKHISKYSNTRIGIDGHAWLHQMLPNVAYELYNGIYTDRHIIQFVKKVKALILFNIYPIVIFDGDSLSSKKKTVQERRQLREKYKIEVEHYLKNNQIEKAKELMKRCVTVNTEILNMVFKALRNNGIEYIVSPYEADAQLYFLQKINYIDYIITEDSDLIVYGCKSILYKYNGSHVEEYDSKHLHLCKDSFFAENILEIAILSGCDYLDSIKGIGLITAYIKMKQNKTVEEFIREMIMLNKNVPENYFEEFLKAKLTFLHHIVYNPIEKKRKYLNESKVSLEFLGTLEDLPLKINSNLGNELETRRHFIPENIVKRKNIVKRRNNEWAQESYLESDSIDFDSVEVDSNLMSPYF